MKLTNLKSKKSKSGITLIELTVVILVLLSLISVLFVGARAWLRGSERGQAAILIRNAQQGCRSQTNILGLDTPGATGVAPTYTTYTALWVAANPGSTVVPSISISGGGTSNLLQDAVFGPGAFVETAGVGTIPTHPAAGVLFTPGGATFEEIPSIGGLYMTSNTNPAFYAPSGIQ